MLHSTARHRQITSSHPSSSSLLSSLLSAVLLSAVLLSSTAKPGCSFLFPPHHSSRERKRKRERATTAGPWTATPDQPDTSPRTVGESFHTISQPEITIAESKNSLPVKSTDPKERAEPRPATLLLPTDKTKTRTNHPLLRTNNTALFPIG